MIVEYLKQWGIFNLERHTAKILESWPANIVLSEPAAILLLSCSDIRLTLDLSAVTGGSPQ